MALEKGIVGSTLKPSKAYKKQAMILNLLEM